VTSDQAHEDGAQLIRFAMARWQAEGAIAIADVYKWLFQATQGSEHVVNDPAAVRAWLEQEWASLTPPAVGEPLLVPLRPDGLVVRLHLRPFCAADGDQERLPDAFLASAALIRPNRAAFATAWHALGTQLRSRTVGPLTSDTWAELERVTAPQGYPAVRHSAGYRAAHHPAYRVLAAEEVEGLVTGLRQPSWPRSGHT
jgi:hypothetical protein